MADKVTNTTEETTGIPSPGAMVPSSSKFTFESVDDLLLPPNTPEFTELMSPEYNAMLKRHADQINSYSPPAIGNLNNPNPTLATNTYDPYTQTNGLNLSTSEGKLQLLSSTGKYTKPTEEAKIEDPIYAGIRASNFDRYYNHPEFSNLGWHPYANNEEYYNANSTIWDDLARSSVQFAKLATTGFLSAYRSIGDLFDSDDYFTGKDLDSAREFSDAMRIGNSTRGGAPQFLNNLFLQSGYTFGVIGSIAVEELALWGAAALQGGLNPVSDAAAASRTAFNFGRLYKTIKDTFKLGRLANATRNMYRGLNSVDNAKDAYTAFKSGGRFIGDIIAPETAQAIRTLNSTKNGVQNLSNMAKASATFGGFYRDLRSLNLALSESKMEGGMVYDQQIANGYALQTQLNKGEPITTEQMENIVEKAARASYYTTLLNAPTIYLSNQLVLGNAFGAYNRSLSRMLRDNIDGVGRRIIKTEGSRPFMDVGEGVRGYLKRIKNAGAKGSAKMAAQASLRYFSANLSEGLQELTQEAIAHGTKDYFTTLLKDPAAGGYYEMMGTLGSAVSSQFSAQGFETFMSGFLMGGLVQGPQKLFFQGVPALYQKKFQKEKYELYKAEKKKYIDNLVTAMNDTYEVTATNPMESLFHTAKNNLVIQKQAGVDMLQAAFDSSNLDFVDAKDFSKFQAIYAILANNQAGEFRQQFEDYLKLSDEELAEAFPSFKKDIKSGKLRQRAQDMITQIDSLEDSYHANKDKFVNPFDPDVYKYGSRQWNDENIKRKAFEHARYLYMFTEDGFKRALERSQTIFDELSAEPLFGKQAASDITVLLDEKSINKEIMILAAEISTLDPKENKDIINAKTKKLEGLRGIVDVLYADENLTKDGFFDRRKINKLRAPFEKYLNNLAKSKDTFVDAKKVDGAISKLVDYKTLQGRAVAYNKSIEYLNNPARFEEIYQRSYEFLKSVYKNRVKIFRDSVENYVGKQEINQFLNELAKLDIYPDPQQVKEFMDTGNIDELVNFYTEDGLVDPIGDEKLFNEIQALKNAYKQAVTPEVTEETEQEQAESRERRGLEADLQKILDQNQIGEEAPAVKVFGINKNSNPVVKRVLEDKRREYVKNQATLNNDNILEPDQWRDTEGQKYLFANEALKKIWFDDLTNQGQEITDQDFNNDVGFEEWLKDQQDNPVVKNLLYEAEITLSDFVEIEASVEIPEVQEPEIKGEIAVGKRMKMSDDYTSVNILQSSATDDTGNIKPIYKVVGKKGEEISQELLQAAGLENPLGQTPNQIEEKAKKLDDVSIATKPFLFAGVEMSYGTTVTDSKGNRFVVIGTEGGKLSILDIKKIKEGLSKKDKEKLASKVTEAQFKAKYKLEEINFIKLPKDVSRLQLDEFVDVYPYQHNKFSNNPEPIKDSRARLQRILENLTPEERNNLSIIIERNSEGGILRDKKFQTRNSDGNMGPSNPYIETVTEPFKIGLAFGSTETQDRISKELDKKGIKPYYGTGGVFAFVSSGSVLLLNEKGDPVNPLNITKEILENTFTIYPSQQATAVEDVANNYAVQQGLLNRISELIEDGDQINLTLKDLPGFYFNASSKVKFDENNPKSPNDLTYNTVDGVKVIMVNDRLNDGRISTTYITDIKDPAKKREFRQKLEEGINLQDPNLYNTFQNSQRYVMVIKTPNGQFAGAGLVAAKLSQEEINKLDRELAAQGIKTINENFTEDKEIKDVNINNDFNEKFNKKLYITTNKRGFSIEINVSSDGTFRADIYDKSKKTKEGVAYFGGRQQTLDLEGKESPGIIKRLISEIDKGIKKEKERLEKEKKELPEWVKLKVSLENVRTSFPADPEIDVILNNTTTKVGKDVRTNYKLTLSADDNIVQESKAVITTVDNFSKEPEVEQEPSPVEVTPEVPEQEVPEVTAERPEEKEIKRKREKITELRNEILEDKSLNEIQKFAKIDADPEIKKLNKEIKQLEAKLIANKLLNKNLTNEDITDIEEFSDWASKNLPDFITIADIKNLKDNLVYNGVRVGAFALSMNDIAGGLKIKGTIYTGASNPFKYHEAFHAVFRTLLTNEQQDRLYAGAKKDVKKKYGAKYAEELEMFKNSADKYRAMGAKALEREFLEEYMADEFEKFKKDPRSTKAATPIKNFFNKLMEWLKALFGAYSPNELQNLFREIDSGKFKSASPINNRFTDSLATGITVNANKIIPVDFIKSDSGQFGYRVLDNATAKSIVNGITARVVQLELDNKKANFNVEQAVNDSFFKFRALYSTRREGYNNLKLTNDQERSLRDIEKAFAEYGDFIKENVYEQLKFYEIKSTNIEEANEENDANVGDRVRLTDQYDKDVTSIGGFSSLSTFLRKYIGTTSLYEKDQFGNDYLIDPELDANGKVVPGTGEKLMVTVDFATAYNGFLKAVKNVSDPIKILQRMYLFGISNPQTKAVVDKLFNDLGIKWEGQLENGELPQYTTEVIEKFKGGEPIPAEELTQGMRKPLLFQAVLKGFENARVDYLFVHRTEEGRVVTYSAAKRDDAHTQIDRWGQAYLVLSKKLKTDEDVRKDVVDKFDELLDYLQYIPADEEKLPKKTVEEISDQQLQSIAAETSEVLFNNVGIYLHPKFIEYSIVKNVVDLKPYQKALLNANSDEKALDYDDIYRIKLIIENNGDPFTTTDEGAKNRLNRIALGNAAFDENVGASVFKNPNGDFVYAHQLPTFHLKKIQQLNDVGGEGSTIEQLKTDRYLANNLLVNDRAFKQMSADGTLRVLRISGSKKGNIDVNEDGMMSETSGKTPTSGKTYGDSTPKDFILSLINAYTYGVDTLSGKVRFVVWENKDGTINKEAIAPVLMRVLEASNTGDMLPLPVKKAVEKLKGETVISDITLNSIFNNIKAEFERIQRESNPETATQELIVGFNALAERNEETGTDYIVPIDVASSNVDEARAFNFNKTGVLLNPLGKKKESRKGVVTLQTSEAKVNRVKEGEQKSLIYNQNDAEKYIGFTTTGVTRRAVVKTKESEEGVSTVIKSKGLVRLTLENRDAIFTALKGSWSEVKTDQHKYEVKVGTKKYYTESENEQTFLQGDKSMYMYDIIQAGDIESDIEVDFKTTGYEDDLLKAARSPENKDLTFEESLEKANISKDDLLSFIRFRLNQEFDQFKILLDELIDSDDLGNFITKGILTSSGASNANTQRSNNLLNLIPKDTDYNLKQIFFNDYINTTAINQILLGDTAYTLKDAVDEIKRAKAQNAAYYSAASSIAAPAYGIYKPLQEFSLFSMTEPYAKSTYNKSVTKVADAQLYMTTKAFRNFQFGFGKLTASQAELFNKIERGEDIDPDEFFGTADTSGYISRKEMLNSQKLVYADGRTFVKMSAFPLLPQFTSIKDKDGNYTIPKPNKVALHNLRVKLEKFEAENNTVATAAPLTALKMLKQNVSDIYKLTGTETALTLEQSTTLDANFLGLQVINPSNKTVITDPSQIKSLVTSEQDDKTEVFINGKKTDLGKIRTDYHKATRDRGNLNYISKRNLVFTFDVGYAMDELQKSIKENEITADLYTYLKYAEASLASTGSSSHLMELFSLNENGEQKYNLNNPLTQTKFMNLFMSYFSKSVFREKIPGATVALVSDYGVRVYRRVFSVDENGKPDRHEIITEKQFEAARPTIELNIDEGSYPGNDDNLASLKSRVEKSKGKGVVIIDRLRNGLKEYDKEGKHTEQRYGEMMMPSHHKEVMQELELQGKSIPEVVGKMFAVRIPSQDNHSTYNVKWVDFMPAAYGSSAVFAREIVEISGADFDIDKVFMQFKEFYNKGGEFFEYGKQTEEKARYQDYARYVNKKVKDSQSIYGEALSKYKARGTTNSLTDADIKEAVELGMSRNSIDALSVLSLPRTLEEYKAYTKDKGPEPYTAALNNDILDYKFALMGNNHVTEKQAGKDDAPISYKAADLKVLEDLWEQLKVELPILEELSKEEGIDVDNLFGKVRMFANNKEGARSIGAVVLPNLYLNLLQEFDIKIQSEEVADREKASQIKFKVKDVKDENPFLDFKTTYEKLEDGTEGERTQYIISALITAATDNAKERLLPKLGLNINALSVVANLTALGVPIKTSILLVNHPVIRQAYFQEANAPEDAPVKAVKVVKNRIKDLQKTFLEDVKKDSRVEVSQKLLSDAIANELLAPKATIKDMKEIREEGGISKMDVVEEISILEQFVNAANLANTTRYMGDLLNLSSGLGQGIEAIDKRHEAIEKLGLDLTDKEYALLEKKPMVDVRKIFKGNTWQAGYLERFEEFTNILLPKVVLSTTPLFKEITNAITKQTSYRVLPYEQRNKFRAQLQKDLLSYLTIKAYQYNGLVTQSQTTATLTNDLIYDQKGVENITQVVGRLRDLFKEKGATNYFLDSFVVVEGSKDINNKSGINIAGANTFLRYNDTQKLDIQNGFMELYADPVTRYDAMAIVHYMMVKDGLQFAYKSLVEAVAPIALDKYLSHIDTVQVAMTRPTDTVFESTFGLNVVDLVEDFTKGYLTSAPNAYILNKVKANSYKPNAKNIDPTQVKGQPTALTSSQIKNKVVYVDESQETASLVVDLYKGITKVETTLNDTELREVSDVKLNTEKIKKKLEKNIKDLEKAGFRIFKTRKNRKLYDEVEFPLIVRVNVGNEYAPNYKYFELQKTQSILPEKSIINYSRFALGNYARYVEVDLKGSYNQNSIGFMFGDRPTTKYIRNLVNSIADTSKSDQSFDNFDIKYNLDNIDTTKGKPIAAGSTVVATNKGITVDGTNIKDYTVPDVDPNIEAMVEPSVDTEAVDFINDENFSIPATASIINNLENVAGGFKPPAQVKKEDLVKLTVAELDAKYPILAAWWDKNLGTETEEGKNNRNKLIENKQDPNKKFDVNDFVDFVYSYELNLADELVKTEKEFIEIFKCSLK